MDFPTEMKKKRIELGLTQKQFAKKAETSPQMVINYEKGYVEPSYKKFLMICNLLDLNPCDFMKGIKKIMNEITELKKRNNKLLQEIERLKKKLSIVSKNYDLYCRMEEENIELKEKLSQSVEPRELFEFLSDETRDKFKEILNEKDNSNNSSTYNF